MTDSTLATGARFLINVTPRWRWRPGIGRQELSIDAHHLTERPACLRSYEDSEVLAVTMVIERHRDVSWALPRHTFLVLSNIKLAGDTPEILASSRSTLLSVQDATRSWVEKSILHRGMTEAVVAF